MKIRHDFVTNSSSTCFIIAYKREILPKTVIKKYPYLQLMNSLVENIFNTDVLRTKEEARNLITEQYLSWNLSREDIDKINDLKLEEFEHLMKESIEKGVLSPWVAEKYIKITAQIEKGFNVGVADIEYSNKQARDIIDKIIDNDNFILIEKEND